MPVQTIEQLKEKWVNGYRPNEDDFVDLFDSFASNTGGGATGSNNLILGKKKETINRTIDAKKLNFDGTGNSRLEIIPAKTNKVILVHAYYIACELITAVAASEDGFGQVVLAYSAPANVRSEQVTNIPVNLKGKNLIFGTGDNLQFYFFTKNTETPIGQSLILKGTDGVKMTGITGELLIKVDYSYMDFPFRDIARR